MTHYRHAKAEALARGPAQSNRITLQGNPLLLVRMPESSTPRSELLKKGLAEVV
jgi:hypothetical protein